MALLFKVFFSYIKSINFEKIHFLQLDLVMFSFIHAFNFAKKNIMTYLLLIIKYMIGYNRSIIITNFTFFGVDQILRSFQFNFRV